MQIHIEPSSFQKGVRVGVFSNTGQNQNINSTIVLLF